MEASGELSSATVGHVQTVEKMQGQERDLCIVCYGGLVNVTPPLPHPAYMQGAAAPLADPCGRCMCVYSWMSRARWPLCTTASG